MTKSHCVFLLVIGVLSSTVLTADLDPCLNVKCPTGKICQNGKCVKISVSVPLVNAIKCDFTRPSGCPIIQNPKPSDFKYCGITYEGLEIEFTDTCNACRNIQVDYYFKGKCSATEHLGNQCTSYTDCRRGQSCIFGKCVDLCRKVICSTDEICRAGICYSAISSIERAVNLCAGKDCSATDHCVDGKCVPLE